MQRRRATRLVVAVATAIALMPTLGGCGEPASSGVSVPNADGTALSNDVEVDPADYGPGYGTNPGEAPDTIAVVPNDLPTDDSDSGDAADVEDSVALCRPSAIPVLDLFPYGFTFNIDADEASVVLGDADEPGEWQSSGSVTLPTEGALVTVFARNDDCAEDRRASLRLGAGFPGAAESSGSDAVSLDEPTSWAAEVVDVVYGGGVDEGWRVPERALGPATTDVFDVLVLGNGGSVVLSFDPPAFDGPGPDLAVYENAFNDRNLELARVEVSSDGLHWARFASASLTTEPVSSYGAVDPAALMGLAGKYKLGFGTPFDLSTLAGVDEVEEGLVDLNQIRFVRILDVIGSGVEDDSFGAPIYDPTPTFGSGGFDLEAVGVLNASPPSLEAEP